MEYTIKGAMFVSALVNLIYFNFMLASFMSKKGFNAILEQHREDEAEGIKQIAYMVLAFLGVLYFDVVSAYSLYNNFSLSAILNFGSDAINFALTIIIEGLGEILPEGVYDGVEYLFGLVNIELNQQFLAVVGLLLSLFFNYYVFKTYFIGRKKNNTFKMTSPENLLFKKDYDSDSACACFASLIFFEATGNFMNNQRLVKMIPFVETPSTRFNLAVFNTSINNYFEQNDIFIRPSLGKQSHEIKYNKQRLKYLNKIYTKLYAELIKLSDSEKVNLISSLTFLSNTLNQSVIFSKKQSEKIIQSDGSGNWMNDSLNKSLQSKLSEFRFRGVLDTDEAPLNESSRILSIRLDELKKRFSDANVSENIQINNNKASQIELLNNMFDFILENNPDLDYDNQEKSNFKAFADKCLL
jgi:hypothetical protein